MSIELTDGQRRALQDEQGKPVDVVDPATNQRYVLLAQAQYELVWTLLEQPSPPTPLAPRVQIPPLMLKSMQAFWRDLPELLKLKSKNCQWVAYDSDERI